MPIKTWALILALWAYPAAAFAQAGFHSCEPTPERIAFYQKTVKPSGTKRIELLLAELAKDPDDLFLNRWYLESPQLTVGSLRDEYRKKLELHPGDPRFLYLYGRALMGADTPKAIEYLDQAKAKDPELMAVYLALMEVYASPNFKSSPKLAENMLAYSNRCPADLSGFTYLGSVEDKVTAKLLAARFRKAAEGRNTIGVAAYYPRLWAAEFHAADPTEFDKLRKRVAEDLKRVKELDPENTRALIEGYKLIGDSKTVKALEEKTTPSTPVTRFDDALKVWSKEHPWPKADAPREAKDSFFQQRLKASEQWVKDYPDETHAWYWRLVSLGGVSSTPAADLERAGEKVLRMDANRPQSWTTVPYSYTVAQEWSEHDIRLKDCIQLSKQAIAELERSAANGPDSTNDMRRSRRPETSGMTDAFAFSRFNIWRVEADVSRKLKDFDQMRAVIGEMKAWLDRNSGGNPFLYFEYLRQEGRLAEEEGHPLDALTYYQSALHRLDRNVEVKERARALWTELGGGKETFELWLKNPEAPKAAGLNVAPNVTPSVAANLSPWTAMDKPLPLNAPDLSGKTWTIADLKGKRTLINVWATWCGPCREELPELQKLYDQVKQHKEMQVITINMDANPGVIGPFLEENKYTFPVVLGKSMVDELVPSLSIPRNWIVDTAANLRLESIGFARGTEWPKQMLDKLGELPR